MADPARRSLDYHVVDVFTDRPFAGNPLAVVLDADDLTDGQLQALASEFNLSETAFPMRPTSPDADYRVRIFTPAMELPFAGHPSVGTAWLLRSLGRFGDGEVVQECGAGLLPVHLGDLVRLSGGPPVVGDPLPVAEYCAAVGLDPGDAIGTPVRWAGTGIEFAYLHVEPAAVAKAVPHGARVSALGGAGISVFSMQGADVHARVFAGGAGVLEDPATGSAALALGVFCVASGLLPGDGESPYVVAQGIELGRPSRLMCTVQADAGRVVKTYVAGAVVPIAQGRIAVPPAD